MITKEDAKLVKDCIAGDRSSQEQLYQKYCRRLMGICYRYAHNRVEAEDFLQEAFIRIFKNLKNYNATGSFEGWLKRIVINTVLEFLRKKSLMFKVVNIDEVTEYVTNDALDQMNIRDLAGMIQELAPGYRTIFNLYACEGYTHSEIAEQLGISEGTSKSQYWAARKILREKILEHSKEFILKT